MSLAVKLALTPVLLAQGLLTRARMPRLPEAQGPRAGRVGSGHQLRLLVAGDSSAAGVGVAHQRDALAAPLAAQLAALAGVCVDWQLLARSGLNTADTLAMLQAEPPGDLQADVAVIVTGVNDVTGQVPSQRALAVRQALANWLRNACGVQHVAFCPLPPVHAFPGLPQPLRWVAGADARRHNDALREWTSTRGDCATFRSANACSSAGIAAAARAPSCARLPLNSRVPIASSLFRSTLCKRWTSIT